MGYLFETGKKARGRRARKAPHARTVRPPFRPRGFFLGLLRLAFNLGLLLVAGALVAVSAGYGYVVWGHDAALSQRYPDLPENSTVYDVDGRRMGEFRASENRTTVGADDLGTHLPDAVVAIEDARFYAHPGVDPRGIARAAYTDLRALTVSQGGSTITEQLTKNLYIEEERRGEISPWRRFEQAALAVAYERRHTKGEVLTAYLNTVYFGKGAYGAEEAAETYFGKEASELSLAEAATLAGVLHAPSTYLSGDDGTRLAVERRDQVLQKMREADAISSKELRDARAEPLELAPAPPPDEEDYEPFLELVRRETEERFGDGALEDGGLKIHTTMRPDLQRDAVASIEEALPYATDPSGAVSSVEPQTGAVRAVAGEKDDFNLALDARRQPGSSFKPFVLAAAVREYVSPETTLYASRDLDFEWNGERVRIENYDSIERGAISLNEAMAESDNTVFVQLAMDLGLENVVRAAKDLGIESKVDPYPSTAIGGLGAGVSSLEMSSAYATLAAGGVYREPYSVERVDRVGFGEEESVYDHRVEGRRVLNGDQAAMATRALRGVVEDGTASRFHDLDEEIGRPSAGKTGTTDDFVDAWYVGYTQQLSTAVWVGYPEGRRPMVGVHGLAEVHGENLPLDLWSLYMAQATQDDPVTEFRKPDEREFFASTRGQAVDAAGNAYASNNATTQVGYGGG